MRCWRFHCLISTSCRPSQIPLTDYLGPNKPEGKVTFASKHSLHAGPVCSTYSEDGDNVHVQFSLETFVHLLTDLFDFIVDRKGVIVDIDLGVGRSTAGLVELVLLT